MPSSAPARAVAISHSSTCAAQVGEAAVERQHHDGVAGVGQRAQRRGVRVVAQRHEQAVVAVGLGPGERLAHDGHHARAVLARRLGQQLLEPEAERGLPVGRHDRQLVAAGAHPGRHGRGQPGPGVGGGRGAQPVGHPGRRVEQIGDVGPRQQRRDDAEVRQGRVAAADVGPVLEGGGEPAVGRQRGQVAAGIGDDREAGGVGVPLPRPGEVAARSRASSPTWTRRRAACARGAARARGGRWRPDRWCRARAAPGAAGSVAPLRATTSGNRLEPPMPASRTWSTPRRQPRAPGGRARRAPPTSPRRPTASPGGRRSRWDRLATACGRAPQVRATASRAARSSSASAAGSGEGSEPIGGVVEDHRRTRREARTDPSDLRAGNGTVLMVRWRRSLTSVTCYQPRPAPAPHLRAEIGDIEPNARRQK